MKTKTANELLDELMIFFKVSTMTELSKHLGVARNTISGWKKRNSVSTLHSIIYAKKIPISVAFEERESSSTDSIHSYDNIPIDLKVKDMLIKAGMLSEVLNKQESLIRCLEKWKSDEIKKAGKSL